MAKKIHLLEDVRHLPIPWHKLTKKIIDKNRIETLDDLNHYLCDYYNGILSKTPADSSILKPTERLV